MSADSHIPVVTSVWLESVTLLPTCMGFSEACILWLCAGARNRKQGTDNIQSFLIKHWSLYIKKKNKINKTFRFTNSLGSHFLN